MKEFREEDFLMISGIQHFVFCERQWALIHIEQQWYENELTIDGNFMHEKVHDGMQFEKRKNTIISRGMAVRSFEFGISGICDVVEFTESNEGIPIKGRTGLYEICPVEYKRGHNKMDDSDLLQIVAQAVCLEEMFCCKISKGYLYYGETRRRSEVLITDDNKKRLLQITERMHELFDRKYTPKIKKQAKCRRCSLQNICVPEIQKENVEKYIQKFIGDEG